MDYFLSVVEDRIAALSFKQQVLYMALNCEKLLPNYIEFYRRTNRGDLEVFEEAMVILYQYLQDMPLGENELENTYNRIVEAIPEPAHFKTALTPYAVDTATAFADAIEYLLSEDIGYVAGSSYRALQTVTRFTSFLIQKNADDEQESAVGFTRREIERQTILLTHLKEAEITLPFIAFMREMNKADGPIIDWGLLGM
ncbi:YjaG family protein [Emticicia fluvialis]|uniref:YjaG family protein n=1 Tax=Emticicia fluvialis TaxID=2974474 RepID=UPI0021668F0E|nr:YjaG family protein [Emticicia fluvialis]